MNSDLKPHPLAEIFPPMTDAELAALTENIKTHGQLKPIALLEGMILDGRHRYAACRKLGIAPKAEEFHPNGLLPMDFVMSMNYCHRHLSSSQKACIAAKWYVQAPNRALMPKPNGIQKVGRRKDIASRMFGVSALYVMSAKRLLEQRPKTFQEVFEGKIYLGKAHDQHFAPRLKRVKGRVVLSCSQRAHDLIAKLAREGKWKWECIFEEGEYTCNFYGQGDHKSAEGRWHDLKGSPLFFYAVQVAYDRILMVD